MRLTGSAVVVTGASSGIGRATALALAAEGARVVAVGRNEDALADVTAQTRGTWLAVDVRDPDAAERIVKHTLAEHGRLDVVVANAGVGWAGRFEQMRLESIEELVAVNLVAPLALVREALPALTTSRGGMVFVSSIAGVVPVGGESVYAATKAAVEAFAASLREEVHGSGVLVSTVQPGPVATPFFARRGADYDRGFPRPIPAERVAGCVLRALTRERERVVVPGWLRMPAAMHRYTPALYSALARRFG